MYRTKLLLFEWLVLVVLLNGCKTCDMKRLIAIPGKKGLHGIMGCHWSDHVSNKQVLCEIELKLLIHFLWIPTLAVWAFGLYLSESTQGGGD